MPLIDISDANCPLPDVLIFDANILLSISPLSQRQPAAIRNFLKRVGDESLKGRIICVAPVITFEECYFKIIQNRYRLELPNHEARLQATLGRTKIFWHDLYKDSPGLIQSYVPELGQFRQAILNIPILPLEPEDLSSPPPLLEEGMFEHIQQVQTLPKDAYFLAIAQRLNAPHVATMDRDFQRVSWLNVYTVI